MSEILKNDHLGAVGLRMCDATKDNKQEIQFEPIKVETVVDLGGSEGQRLIPPC